MEESFTDEHRLFLDALTILQKSMIIRSLKSGDVVTLAIKIRRAAAGQGFYDFVGFNIESERK